MRRLWLVLYAGVFGYGFFSQLHVVADAKTKESVLYSFCGQENCADGEAPSANLIDVHDVLYGTTYAGGSNTYCNSAYYTGCGTAFAIDPDTGAEAVLYAFCSQSNCPDGANPQGALLDLKGKLYGTTCCGGAKQFGTVFALDPQTGAETVLHSFCNECQDGAEPVGALIDVRGALYGATYSGGEFNYGTVFSVDPNSGAEKVVYTFGSYYGDAGLPEAGLTEIKGLLYGTTLLGGAHASGAVFALNPRTGAESVLYSFCSQANCTDGEFPYAGLINVNGTLYGTTQIGGTNTCARTTCGIVFSVDPKTGSETVLHSFQGYPSDGAQSIAGLVSVNGMLFGTSVEGGAGPCQNDQAYEIGCGTVFELNPRTGAESVVYSFCKKDNCADGEEPKAGLLAAKGTLYGTTWIGGSGRCSGYNILGCGTVFSLRKP